MGALNLEVLPSRTWSWLTALLLLLGVAGTGYALQQRVHWQQAMEVQDTERYRLEHRQRAAQLAAASHTVAEDPKAVAAIVPIARELRLPWGSVLDTLQQAAGPAILLQKIQPDLNADRIEVQGQADNRAAFVAYLERLGQAPGVRAVQPLSEEANNSDRGKPLVFRLSAQWEAPP